MWPSMHMVHVLIAGSYMHPVHDKQETLLNVRGIEDSLNSRTGDY